jgi:hypothetical protein
MIAAKQKKLEDQRQQDQQNIAAKVELRKQMRESRSDRLLEEVLAGSDAVVDVALDLQTNLACEDAKRQALHAERQKKVFEPLATQLFERLNPAAPTPALSPTPKRRTHQSPSLPGPSRSRSAIAVLADEPRLVSTPAAEDPLRRPFAEHAWEEAFHQQASEVINGHGRTSSPPSRCNTTCRARSRPVLEPTHWGPQELQDSTYGRFEEMMIPGAIPAALGKKAGSAPCESDGVPSAGKRTIRAGPRAVAHNDLGLLQSPAARRGEAAMFKDSAPFAARLGASSAAPLQDHFTYDRDPRVTDMEFPLGKTIYTEYGW